MLNGQLPSKIPVIMIDVTIMTSPCYHNLSHIPDTTTAQFEHTENYKFSQYQKNKDNKAILREMNRKRMALIPFVVDGHGNLGPYANNILFKSHTQSYTKRDTSGLTSNHCQPLMERTITDKSLVGILPAANKRHLKEEHTTSFYPITK